MGDMADAVDPADIPAEYHGRPALRITVLADPAGQCFDSEPGNAGVDQVATGMALRHQRGEWSVGYTDESNCPGLTQAMTTKGLAWADAAGFPAPGVYLWAADPTGEPHLRPSWAPVGPVACQDRHQPTFDLSTTAPNFDVGAAGYIDGKLSVWPAEAWADYAVIGAPAPAPPAPEPAPAPTVEVTVLLPELSEGSTGPSVEAVQKILGGLTVDGVFGPLTRAGVEAFQGAHGLAVDGVVGVHTWGSLLGHPQ